jgi:hypothetical protein
MPTLSGAVEVESISLTGEEDVTPQNFAPIAENLQYTTYKNVSINGNFQAVDPEGDLLSFRLVSSPKKGTVQVSDNSFVYSPKSGKKGKDSFTYVAVDSYGNVSGEAKVSILIEKQSTKISYSDMQGNGAYYSALRLAEEGIFVGEKIGKYHYFDPDTVLTRGEFLSMCLTMADISLLEDITKTGFADDEEMPLWLKPYVSTALMSGMIKGYFTPTGSVVFDAMAPVTKAEAAVLIDGILKLNDVESTGSFDLPTIPAWASQSVTNLYACDILGEYPLVPDQALTRADAAEMLSSAMDLLDARDSKDSLLSWAW